MVDISSGDKKINITVSTSGNKASVNATPDTAMYYSNKSREWAISDKIVSNEDYSSKYYANLSKQNADKSTVNLENLTTNYNQYKNELENTKNISVEEIETAKTNAISDIINQETLSVDNVNTAGETQVNLAKEQAIIATEQAEIATAKASEVVESGNVALSNISNAKTEAITNITNQEALAINSISTNSETAIINITNQENISVDNVNTAGETQINLATEQANLAKEYAESIDFDIERVNISKMYETGAVSTDEQGYNQLLEMKQNAIETGTDYVKVNDTQIEIPYTLSKTGSKIVDVAYRDRVIDLYEQTGQAGYYTIDEENKNFTLPMGEIYGMIENKASVKPSGSIPLGTEIALASTIAYVPSGFLPTDGTEYNASDFQEFQDEYLVDKYDKNELKIEDPIQVGTYMWKSITYGNGKFVAVGHSGYTTTSTDGVTWTTPVQVGTSNWYGVAYGNGKFVAVGDNGYTTTSTDGVTWTTPVQVGSTYVWNGITYVNGKFVAVGNSGYTTTSTDGVTWTTPVQVGTSNWYGVAYGNGKFVAVGYRGYTTTSTDGVTWTTPVQVGSTYVWNGITYVNGKFVAVGNSGYTTTSTDGVTWTTPVQVGTSNWYGVAYGHGKFVAVGYGGYTTTSTDGVTWTTPVQVGTSNWYGVAYGNGKFVAVGDNGYTCCIAFLFPLIETILYSQYATELSTYGQCSKFGIDSTNKKFKVPTKLDNVYRYYVCVDNETAKTAEEWTAYVESLGGNTKANSSYALDYAPRIIQTYQSGYSGYIVWSNGYCEQWGYDTTASKTATVTLTKEYKDMNFNITDALGGPSSSGTYSSYTNLYKPMSTSSFTIYKYDTNAARFCYWRTRGVLADGQY